MEIETVTEPEGTPAGTEQEAGGAPETGAVERLLGEFRGTLDQFGSRFDTLERRIPEPAREEAPEGGGSGEPLPVPVFEENDYDENGELSMEAQVRAIQEIAQSVATQQVQAAMSPILQQQQEASRVAYAEYLESEYPDLQDEATQDRVLAETASFAEAIGRPELARQRPDGSWDVEPRLLEQVYLASRAKSTSDREVPAGSTREVAVERGGGAGPAPGADANDGGAIGDRIVSRAQKRMYRLGSGS